MPSPAASELAEVPLFEGLSAAQLAHLAGWLEVEEFGAGESPTRTGTHGYAFFILASGTAHAERGGQVLEQLKPGSVFGEMAFFAPDSRRSATVVAETPIRVFSMFGTEFRSMQMELPEVAQRLADLFAQRHARDEAAGQA